MKKIITLLASLPMLLLFQQGHSQMINTFPFCEDFETFNTCGTSCGNACVLVNGWVNQTTGDGIDWTVDVGGTGSGGTGPSVDFMPGTGAGKYLYTEASGSCSNDSAMMWTPQIDLSGSIQNMFCTFQYHMLGGDMGTMHVDISSDSGATWQRDISPARTDNVDLWQSWEINLTPYLGDTVILRIRGLTGPGFTSDMAVDYFCFEEKPGQNAGAGDLLIPANNDCGDSSMVFEIEICNDGPDTISNVPVTVIINGAYTATLTDTFPGSIAPLECEDFVMGTTLNTVAGGIITVQSYTTLVTDTTADNDTSGVDTIEIGAIPPAPSGAMIDDTQLCLGDSTFAYVMNPDSNLTYFWYDSAFGGNEIGSGDTLFFNPTMDMDLWVEGRESATENIGKPDNSGGGGTYTFFPDGLRFDAFVPITIDSVTIYPGGAGNLTVNLLDASSTIINTVTVPVAGTSPERVALGLTVPAGTDWQLNADGSTVPNLYRNNGSAVYPYTGTMAQITSAINNLGGFYYFYYDWQITGAGCPSDRISAGSITVDSVAPVAAFTSMADSSGLGVQFTNMSTDNRSNVWDFGDGNTSTMTDPYHVYAAPGNYIACLTSSNGCGSDTTCDTLLLCAPLSVAFSAMDDSLTVSFMNMSNDSASVLWDFGDGNTSTMNNPTHTYASEGNYTVCLTVTNACAETDSTCMSVSACEPLSPFFIGVPAGDGSEWTFTYGGTGNATSYSWDFGDANTSTMMSPTHTYAADGSYAVSVTVTNACGDTAVFTDTANVLIVGIDIPGLQDISLWPNPNNGQFQVEIGSAEGDNYEFVVFDMRGARVMEAESGEIFGNYTQSMDLGNAPAGMYILKISNSQGSISKKIILE